MQPLCTGGQPYITPPAPSGYVIAFQVCGTANASCVPKGYSVTYNMGSAVQFLGSGAPLFPGELCTDNNGGVVPCTQNCEVLGISEPDITLMDLERPTAGVNMTYQSVPSQANDAFACPFNPATGGPLDRRFRLRIICDEAAEVPVVSAPVETSTCFYEVSLITKHGCGQPNVTSATITPSPSPTPSIAPYDWCFADYECSHRSTDPSRTFFDLRPLCTGPTPYKIVYSSNYSSIEFQICGTANAPCVPSGYKPPFNLGGGVQFLSTPAVGNCTDNVGGVVPCTPACEILGVGVPAINGGC